MNILAFSTSSEILSVCVKQNDIIKADFSSRVQRRHSVVLMPTIDNTLRESGIDIKDIDLFACDIGPGSFTGIRIGTAAVNAFLTASGKMAAGITSLDAIAAGLPSIDGWICIMIYAKNDQIYAAVYKDGVTAADYFAGSAYEFLDIVKAKCGSDEIVFAGDGIRVFLDPIKKKFVDSVRFADESCDIICASVIASLAYKRGGSRKSLIPIYLKSSSAKVRQSG